MRGIRIGRVFGIPIQLNLTFLLILPLFAWLIGSDVDELVQVINELFGSAIDAAALTTGSIPWILGSAAAIGLFLCVLFHEFGHSLVAMHYGYEIDSITLWLFGGVASFAEMPEDWRQELVIAVAGPIVSVALGVISFVGFVVLPATQGSVKFVLGYLALTNILLAVFNMLPGFPMDGGRVLRALLARRRSHARATKLAAEVGKMFAFLLGIFGLFYNLFLVALAFFIYMGASSEAQQTVMKAAFEDVTVRDVMTPREKLDVVDIRTSVSELLDRMFYERHTGYPVVQNGRLVGMVTLNDARTVDEVERDAYIVKDVMSGELTTISPSADAMDAITTMQQHGVGRLPVVDDEGELVGLISRSDLVTALNIIQSRGPSTSIRPRDPTDVIEPR
ncbi:CBS domain-containing protein [Halogeometricum borinquense]|uniref:Zinc metalloprotease n=1 Tax=Halogeometricum borinquense TaxID=60847 RepID=A0A6C0UJ77_9EURY|nr:CBS domain-containing protein [Halogeometricum borinquense]QIB73008.1 CBS domain-containing protein [Halogeometricum borinquense]QIQ77597.1 CBS domain-containing protein [Halogeometricum borinquense]